MRILLLTLYYPPDPDPTGRLVEQVARGLVRRGHQVKVLTTPVAGPGLLWEVAEDPSGLAPDDLEGLDVVRAPVLARGRKGSLVERSLTYGSFSLLGGVLPHLGSKRPDVVWATNGGFATGLSGWMAALGRGPCVFNVQDLYPDAAVAAGKLGPGPLLWILRRVEALMYRLSDRIVVNAPAARARLIGKGVAAGKVRVIPNFVDVDAIRPRPCDEGFRREHGLEGAFVVGYSGNVGWVYDWSLVLQVASRLRDRPDVRFLVAGEGVSKGAAMAQAAELGLDNVTFLPFQTPEDLARMRASTDVQIIPYRREAARSSMASKVYEIMAVARPVWVCAEDDTDIADLVRSADCGVVTAPGDAGAAAEALLALRSDPAGRAALGARGRAAAEQGCGLPSAVDAWEELLREVISES